MSHYQLVFNHCSDLIISLDEHGVVFDLNHQAETVLTTSKDELVGKNLFSYCKQNKMKLFFSAKDLHASIESNKPIFAEISTAHYKHRYSFKCVPYLLNAKKCIFLIGQQISLPNMHHDYLKNIIESLPQYIYWKNEHFVYLGCNQRVANYLYLNSPDEIIGKTDEDFGWSKDRVNFLKESDSTVFNEKKEVLIEDQIPLDGTIRTMLTSKSPLYDQNGCMLGIIGVTVDITDRKKLEVDLQDAKEQAESANRTKTEFIANMSHDIRTPLTGVIGLSELLENTLASPQDKEKAHLLHDSGEELLTMLNEILDDVRAERLDKNEVAHECFDLHQTIHDLIRLESPATHLKGLQLNAHIAPDVPQYLMSDRNKIQRVLLNLMGNSIKFTESGSITLTVEALHTEESKVHLKFSIADTGIGIPEEVQSKVFNRFFKVSSSYKGIYTGYGLGLHIVQTYVNLLGGHITLSSTLGKGSTFHFDLECDIGVTPEENQDVHTKAVETSLHHSYHLLLIEDNIVALKSLEALLTARGYTFVSAMSAEDALELLSSHAVDLIITDIGLPCLSGTEFAVQIRAEEQAHHKPAIPIIGLTGHAKEVVEEECRQSGMSEVLSKPAPMDVLDQCIQQLVQRKVPIPLEQKSDMPVASFLGIDLPLTEDELFQLNGRLVFDEAQALTQIPDKALLQTLISTYCSNDIQKDIQQMIQAHDAQDWAQVEGLAHKFKGGVAYLSTLRMKFACQYLERYYKAGHRSLLEPLYQQVLKTNQETLAELTQWLQDNPSS